MSDLIKRLRDIYDELNIIHDKVNRNDARIDRMGDHYNELDEKIQSIVKQINVYDNRDSKLIAEIADLKRLISDTRYTLVKHDNRVRYLERDTAVNRELLKLLIAPSKFKALFERADDIAYRKLHPELFEDEDEDED